MNAQVCDNRGSKTDRQTGVGRTSLTALTHPSYTLIPTGGSREG